MTATVAISLDFLIPRLIPGNPVDAILSKMQGVTVTPAIIHSLDLQFGVGTNASLWSQYTHYWNNVLHGNLGISSGNAFAPVTEVIRAALPYTLGLVGLATVISFVAGTAIGALVGWKRGSWLDSLLPAVTFFQAAPYFFLAFLAIDVFAIKLGWFPSGLAHQELDFPAWNWTYISDLLDHAVLPALTIVVASAAGWIVGMRNVMLTTMDEDYVLIAAAKGLRKRRVDLVRGPQRGLAQRLRLRAGDRVHRVRLAAHRDRVQLSGPRLAAAAGGVGQRLRAAAGASSLSSRSRCWRPT